MGVERLGLCNELEPGPRHRLVVLAGNAGTRSDAADPLGEPGERLLRRVTARETPRDLEVTLVGERRAGDSARLEIVQQGAIVDNTN